MDFRNGDTLAQVQIALGHSGLKTTSRYLGSDLPDNDTAVDFVRY